MLEAMATDLVPSLRDGPHEVRALTRQPAQDVKSALDLRFGGDLQQRLDPAVDAQCNLAPLLARKQRLERRDVEVILDVHRECVETRVSQESRSGSRRSTLELSAHECSRAADRVKIVG